jgi:hypothetical protein
MVRSIATVFTLGLLALQLGCSGASSSTRSGSTMRQSLGTTSRAQLIRTLEEIVLSKYQYQYERTVDTVEDIYMETRWRDEAALDDESAAGYAFARTRIIVTARPRNRTPGTASNYAVTFRAESMVRTLAGDWVTVPMTDMRKAALKEIADEVKTEMTTGIRVI